MHRLKGGNETIRQTTPGEAVNVSTAYDHPSKSGSTDHTKPKVRIEDNLECKTDQIQRLFNFTQIFFFSLTYLSSWETQALYVILLTFRHAFSSLHSNLSAVLTNGGPEALAWGIVIVVCGAMAQSASLAEMASMQPIAGAQYHWTHYLAPHNQKKFITWMQGSLSLRSSYEYR